MRTNPTGYGTFLLFGLAAAAVILATRRKKAKPVTEEVLQEQAEEVLQEQAEEAQVEAFGEPVPEAQRQPEGAAFVAWPGSRRASEMFNAVVAEETRPSSYKNFSGDPNDAGWLTNVAFWETYPEALDFPEGKIPANFKTVPDWKSYANAWVRIYKGIKNIIASKGGKKKRKPANLWDMKDVGSREELKGEQFGNQPFVMIIESKVPSRSSYTSVAQQARDNDTLLFVFVSAKDMKRAAEWLGYDAPPAGYYVGATYGDIDYGFGHSPGSDFSDFVEGTASAYNARVPSLGGDFNEAISEAVQKVGFGA